MENLVINQNENFRSRFLNIYSYSTIIWRFYWVVFISFPIAKGLLRPKVLEYFPDSYLALFLLSYPNFVEAVIGSVSIVVILFLLRFRFPKQLKSLKNKTLYIISISVAAVFVITQELKIHNLGGENVYDANDVIASGIGLLVMLFILLKYGIFVPKKKTLD